MERRRKRGRRKRGRRRRRSRVMGRMRGLWSVGLEGTDRVGTERWNHVWFGVDSNESVGRQRLQQLS